MDKGKYIGLIFINLKKVFDTVDHAILLKKLKTYGVTGLEHEWFISYLNNRRLFCKINGTSSQLKEITCGVRQGSCLGPLLFLIYIDDLPLSLPKSNISIYADDTAISLLSKNIDELQNDLKLGSIEAAELATCKQTSFKCCEESVNCCMLYSKHP